MKCARFVSVAALSRGEGAGLTERSDFLSKIVHFFITAATGAAAEAAAAGMKHGSSRK